MPRDKIGLNDCEYWSYATEKCVLKKEARCSSCKLYKTATLSDCVFKSDNHQCTILVAGSRCAGCSFYKNAKMQRDSLTKSDKRIKELGIVNYYKIEKKKKYANENNIIEIDMLRFGMLVKGRESNVVETANRIGISDFTLRRIMKTGKCRMKTYKKLVMVFGLHTMEGLRIKSKAKK